MPDLARTATASLSMDLTRRIDADPVWEELGVQPVEFKELVYLADEERYDEQNKVEEGTSIFSIREPRCGRLPVQGKMLPEWFTRKETAEIAANVPASP
jgi:sulfate adenylyltransferase